MFYEYSSFDEYIALFRRFIKVNSLKNSSYREYVLKALFFSNRHLGAEDVHTIIKDDYGVDISLTTVYKALSFLKEYSFVIAHDFNLNSKLYELKKDTHHDHMICSSCNSIFEFNSKKLDSFKDMIAQEHNFTIHSHIMVMYGLCEECSNKTQ